MIHSRNNQARVVVAALAAFALAACQPGKSAADNNGSAAEPPTPAPAVTAPPSPNGAAAASTTPAGGGYAQEGTPGAGAGTGTTMTPAAEANRRGAPGDTSTRPTTPNNGNMSSAAAGANRQDSAVGGRKARP